MKKLTINIFLFITIAFFNAIVVFAQTNQIVFDQITIQDGLSQSTVKAIIKDNQGFMWFATENGLNKFDGYDFTVYTNSISDTTTISGNRITAILEDADGTLWVGTYLNGLNRFDKKTERFQKFMHDDKPGSLSHNSIASLFIDNEGNLWVGTLGGGLNLFNRETQLFTVFKNKQETNNSLASNYIASINQDKNGTLWLSNNAGYLMSFNTQKNTFGNYNYQENFEGQVNAEIFGRSIIDRKGDIWVGTELGLFIFNPETKKFTNIKEGPNALKNNAVTFVYEDNDGKYWILTDHGGINLYNSNKNSFTYINHKQFNPKSLMNDQLYCFYKDNEDNYWIGCYNGGVNVYYRNKYKFEAYSPEPENRNSLNHPSVVSLMEDAEGTIWVGTDGGGLNKFNPATGQFKLYQHNDNDVYSISGNVVVSLHQDLQKNIWVGTYLNGLNKFSPETDRFFVYKNNPLNPNSISHNNIWDIISDSANNLWLATNGGGVNLFNEQNRVVKKWQYHVNDMNTIRDNDVQTLLLDSKDRLWVCTGAGGVTVFNEHGQNVMQFQHNPNDSASIIYNRVGDIIEDSKGRIWLGTAGGLSLYNESKQNFTNFSVKHGLSGNLVKTILEDKNNDLWLGTNKGLTKFHPESGRCINFDINDGLPSNEFNYNTGFVSKSGKLYLGGLNGFISFYPDSIDINNILPNVVLTDFQIFNKSVNINSTDAPLTKHISLCDTVILNYNQSVFTIKYASLCYLSPKKNQYAYKLEGFDPEWDKTDNWNYIGNERKVTYTNLDAGTYVFRVKGTNNDGVWSNKQASLVIIIKPPWWETWMFRSILIALICILLYGFYRLKVKEIHAQRHYLSKEVNRRTKELYESNTQLEEMNQEMNQQREELVTQSEMLAKTNKKLEASTIELENHKNNLEALVKKRTVELERSKEKAEESDRLKTAFLANMSHEIRTPMNAIVGFSNLLTNPEINEKAKANYVGQITSNTKSLLILIDDILDLSMMESNLLNIQKKDFELNILIDEVFLDGNLRDTTLDLRLTNKVEELNLILNSDRYRLKQILVNLFNNACKFTEQGYVELGCFLENNSLVFYVQDSGIGISKENAELVFNRFMKITDDKTKLFRGAGLGLSISKKIATLLNGDLNVESELGKGSRFSLVLPNTIIVKHSVEHENKIEMFKYNWENKEILIVEDEEANYSYLESALMPTKANVTWAQNGEEAINLINGEKLFHLVLMDIKMPVMNGYDATVAIKQKFPKQLIIAQTAYARAEDYVEIKKAGFDDYLIKPIIPDDLYEVLNKYLEQV